VKAQTPQEVANEQTIRKLYSLANATTKDTAGFVAMFGHGGYFYDVGAGKKYYGQDIGVTVDNYATAFPDMHREFINLYAADDLVVVDLTLNGTHKGDLDLPTGVIPPTGREMHTPWLRRLSSEGRKDHVVSLLRRGANSSRTARRVPESPSVLQALTYGAPFNVAQP
jgi:hypothetical protein